MSVENKSIDERIVSIQWRRPDGGITKNLITPSDATQEIRSRIPQGDFFYIPEPPSADTLIPLQQEILPEFPSEAPKGPQPRTTSEIVIKMKAFVS